MDTFLNKPALFLTRSSRLESNWLSGPIFAYLPRASYDSSLTAAMLGNLLMTLVGF